MDGRPELMVAAIVMAVVLVVILPVVVLMSGAALSGLMGWFLTDDAEKRHEGSELLD